MLIAGCSCFWLAACSKLGGRKESPGAEPAPLFDLAMTTISADFTMENPEGWAYKAIPETGLRAGGL